MVKNLPANAGDIRDVCSIPGSGRSPAEGNGNPLQYPPVSPGHASVPWKTPWTEETGGLKSMGSKRVRHG